MTKCEKVLQILSDGLPHRSVEFSNVETGTAGTSRIRELRKRGHVIIAEPIKGSSQYAYRLIDRNDVEILRLMVRRDPSMIAEPYDPCDAELSR